MAIRRALNRLARFGYPHEVHLHARAEIGTAGAVDATHGRFVTIEHSATGVYTATVDNQGGLIDFLYADATVVGGTANLMCRVSANLSTGVFTITVEAADGTTDTDPASGTSLCFRVVAVNSTVL